MDLPNTLSLIEKLVGEGNTEQALEQLVALLDSDPKYAELAQTARVNQGELYEVKAQTLKNTIEPEDARRALNRVADNVLQIVRRVEADKLTLEDTAPAPLRTRKWRYYAIGGGVTLAAALLIWIFWKKKEEECRATYDDAAQYRVMILPFKQTGDEKNFEPEFEIADDLNKLIRKTPLLKAGADVNKGYDIEKNYPSFAEATEVARNCGVQMIVWGKIRKETAQGYKLDVFYKLLDAGEERASGDTTLSKLLKIKDEGQQLTRDVAAVTNLLYIVLASQARVPVVAELIKLPDPATAETDTSWLLNTLALAENHKNNQQFDEAIKTYDRVLEVFPGNEEARQKRGALFFKKGEFDAASRDLEFVPSDGKNANPDLLKVRTDAALKSGNPAKAMENLKQLEKASGKEDDWLKNKKKETRDTMDALQKKLEKAVEQANAKPSDTKANLDVAQTSARLGKPDQVLNFANKVLKMNAKSEPAYQLKVEAQLAKGDTTAAQKTLQTAERNGVNTKSFGIRLPIVKPLDAPLRREQ